MLIFRIVWSPNVLRSTTLRQVGPGNASFRQDGCNTQEESFGRILTNCCWGGDIDLLTEQGAES